MHNYHTGLYERFFGGFQIFHKISMPQLLGKNSKFIRFQVSRIVIHEKSRKILRCC